MTASDDKPLTARTALVDTTVFTAGEVTVPDPWYVGPGVVPDVPEPDRPEAA